MKTPYDTDPKVLEYARHLLPIELGKCWAEAQRNAVEYIEFSDKFKVSDINERLVKFVAERILKIAIRMETSR